jgi:hypothetical protein
LIAVGSGFVLEFVFDGLVEDIYDLFCLKPGLIDNSYVGWVGDIRAGTGRI